MATRKKRKKSAHEDNWAARSRLRRIEYLLWWRGWVRRSDLMRDFGISIAQTSADIQRYNTLNEGAMTYNLNSKRYEAAPRMTCKMFEPAFDEAAREFLGAGMAPGGIGFGTTGDDARLAMLDLPARRIDRQVARRVMIAMLGTQWLRVKYHSLSSGTVTRRKLAPGGLACDGNRWHLRAFCDERKEWLDFVLGRMSSAEWPDGAIPADLPKDTDWVKIETVKLKINPALNKERQEALRMDYGLAGNTLDLRVRTAMKPYLLAGLFLDPENGVAMPGHFVVDSKKTDI